MKILVATDGSKQSMKAVHRALKMAEQEGAQVTLITVASYLAADFAELPLDIRERFKAMSMKVLDDAKALFDAKGISAETVLSEGVVAANSILRLAEEGGFDEIILGSTGTTGLVRALIGSTASKVVSHAPCTVTVVR
ncbi:universal stress protein [Desulforhabdus amnigena]|jgi:nucleotide-binding universal stress UspA family protein|uniref:Universal stress protein UspA n=1 Tax=Desulforhabdus amnigena TaxID=40218 RepID=A0A9W6FUP9_9BACT|nr:universal stress protein [Desulforhabdus amnigena]NLJ27222.1 universal stress protein [Deltaproteobacteria bacterium]GLI35212.1 universal stress protein UspA [Desulforhabdus amnigena]